MKREPVIVAQIVAAIVAILSLLVTLGVIQLGDAQLSQIEQALTVTLTVLAPLIAALWARYQVTPLIDPRDDAGAPLSRPDGSKAYKQ